MGVRVQIAGGDVLQTVFTPNLALADGFVLDNKWLGVAGGYTAATLDYLRCQNNIAGNWEAGRNAATGNNPLQCAYYPIPLLNAAVKGRGQFAQGRWQSRSVNCNTGFGLLMSGRGQQAPFRGYSIQQVTADPTQFYISRQFEGGAGVLLTTTVGWAVNDLLRFEARPNSGGGYDLTTLRNGVVIDTRNDNNVNSPTAGTGYPTFYIEGFTGGAGNSNWQSLSFGAL